MAASAFPPSSRPFAFSACAKSSQPYHRHVGRPWRRTCMDITERFLVFAAAASLMVIAVTVFFALN